MYLITFLKGIYAFCINDLRKILLIVGDPERILLELDLKLKCRISRILKPYLKLFFSIDINTQTSRK